jgi:hypothetical protein
LQQPSAKPASRVPRQSATALKAQANQNSNDHNRAPSKETKEPLNKSSTGQPKETTRSQLSQHQKTTRQKLTQHQKLIQTSQSPTARPSTWDARLQKPLLGRKEKQQHKPTASMKSKPKWQHQQSFPYTKKRSCHSPAYATIGLKVTRPTPARDYKLTTPGTSSGNTLEGE